MAMTASGRHGGLDQPMCDQKEDGFFKSICVHVGVALIAADDRFHIRFWNAAAARVFGGTAETMLGQPITSIVPEPRRPVLRGALEQALDTGEVQEFDLWHQDPDGRAIYLAVTVSPVVGPARDRIGVSVCARDVTRGMDLVRDVAQAQRMSALGSMAGAVAHHFNNLLGGVITTLDFAEAGNDPDMLRRALRTTGAALNRVNGLTHGLLAFAEGDPTDSPTSPVTGAIEEFIAMNEAMWASRSIRVETDLQTLDTPVPSRRLRTILDVLSVNACEAMPDGGTLRFELRRTDEGKLLLRVGDTGVGIPEEHLPHVFEPFFTTKRVRDRTLPDHVGLGLAVAHGIVRDLGGTVTIGPGDEGGTVCSVLLPATPGRD